MCGIAGILSLDRQPVPDLAHKLGVMNTLQAHRGPDGSGTCSGSFWGFGHVRLAIIDLETGAQPMTDGHNWLTFNGEIYNYRELKDELGGEWQTTSDTEVILRSYRKWGADCVQHFRGMFAFALWDEARQTLFCARDRFGIKPFYYVNEGGTFYFASEVKALLPFIDIETDIEGFRDYVTFQFCLDGKTLFKGVRELEPGHIMEIRAGQVSIRRYWEVYYEPDFDHTPRYFENRLRELLIDSICYHLRADVPVGAYVSGGLDSSIVASVASRRCAGEFMGFHGCFEEPGYNEREYARGLASHCDFGMWDVPMSGEDFEDDIRDVVRALDFPVAGPGSFPQYVVSWLARNHRKVVLGGQGGDELFGGYARYLAAYKKACVLAEVNGTIYKGNFVVTAESIIPNMVRLHGYETLLSRVLGHLEDSMDKSYFRLVDRSGDIGHEVNWEAMNGYDPFETFRAIFNGANVHKESYFDLMTHFDFKTLLPALLHVEDRVSMAHGLESRVPFLDHPLVEFVATMPADVKFQGGQAKGVLKRAMADVLPPAILNRTDKMGFPVPLTEWVKGECREFVMDVLTSQAARQRALIDNSAVVAGIENEPQYGRKIWGFLCLELWQQEFHDQAAKYHGMVET